MKQRTNNALVQTFAVDAANVLTNITRTGALTVSGNTPAPASSVTVNGQPAITYQDFTFASSNGFTLANGNNSFTNIARNYYGTVAVTNAFTVNLPQSVALQLDANGNLTNDGTRSFSYDAENQLTNVTVAGQWREDFLYDGLNRRRITRQYTWQGGGWAQTNEIRFIYDGNVVIQEWDSNNVAQVTYTRGIDLSGSLQRAGGIGGLLARTDANGVAFYHADGNGNITALMDTNQYMVARYLYEPFGRVLGKWGKLADANVYRFSSKEYDPASGLYYNRFRYYEPNFQRWLNRDPIGERGGFNLYAHVGNNPINFVDPFGLDIAVIWNGPTSGNPAGHAAIAISGQGVWSYYNNTPGGTDLDAYLNGQIPRRDSKVFIIPTTPEQDAAALDAFKKSKEKAYSWYKHNCANVVNDALDAAKIPYPDWTPALPTEPPPVYWPADPNQTALRAQGAPNSLEYDFPKNTPIPPDISVILKPFNKP